MNKFTTTLYFLAFFLFSGCINLQFNLEFDEVGTSNLTTILDYTDFEEMFISQNETKNYNPCNEMTEEQKINLISCEFENNIQTLKEKPIFLEDSNYEFTIEKKDNEIIYTLKIDEIYQYFTIFDDESFKMPTQLKLSNPSKDNPDFLKDILSLKMMGANIKNTISMPGEIIQAKGANINEETNKAEFDLIELLEKNQTIIVISRQLEEKNDVFLEEETDTEQKQEEKIEKPKQETTFYQEEKIEEDNSLFFMILGIFGFLSLGLVFFIFKNMKKKKKNEF